MVSKQLTRINASGRMDSLTMGLEANATVATGANPRNNLILLASSGSVENATNAGKPEEDTKMKDIFNPTLPTTLCA